MKTPITKNEDFESKKHILNEPLQKQMKEQEAIQKHQTLEIKTKKHYNETKRKDFVNQKQNFVILQTYQDKCCW